MWVNGKLYNDFSDKSIGGDCLTCQQAIVVGNVTAEAGGALTVVYVDDYAAGDGWVGP